MKSVECFECGGVTGDPHWVNSSGIKIGHARCPSCHMRAVTRSTREAANPYDLEDGQPNGPQYIRRPTDAI